MAKKDYPELEGKKIKYTSGFYSCTARIVGCNYYIGVTLVQDNCPNYYLLCLNGPSSPQWNPEWNESHYKSLFYSVVSNLKKDKHDKEFTDHVYSFLSKKEINGGASFEACSFS